MNLLLGVNVYEAKGEAARRQANCLDSLRALKNVSLVNLQFEDEILEVEGFTTLARLVNDSRRVTGLSGARKPILSEVFSVLAEQARHGGHSHFAFANSDIIFTQDAIDRVLTYPKETYIFSRVDFDYDTPAGAEIMTFGTDVFVLERRWWAANSKRFRDYILGEGCWDNVYTSIMLCHSDGLLLNREPLVKHERHPSPFTSSVFAQHNGFLAALDRLYFSLWCEYHSGLTKLRERHAGVEEEIELRRKVFRWNPSPQDRLLQAYRGSKARIKYSLS